MRIAVPRVCRVIFVQTKRKHRFIGNPIEAVAAAYLEFATSTPGEKIVLPLPIPGSDRSAIVQLLQSMLTSGRKQSSAPGYAPLPKDLAARELQSLAQLK